MDSTGRLQECGERLRARGLRSTPQRRAILAAFTGGGAEHLSAEEVYSRAAGVMPGLGRGTVYATLAEYTEVGLLSALGAPEPVRYETNTSQHAHFRCGLCRRIFDASTPRLNLDRCAAPGQRVDRVEVTVEGVCADCVAFCAGVEAGVARIHAVPGEVDAGPSDASPTALPAPAASALTADSAFAASSPGATAAEMETPVGCLLIAATPAGLARIAFPEHGDARALRELVGPAAPAVRAHLDGTRAELEAFFDDGARPRRPLRPAAGAQPRLATVLAALEDVRPGEVRSYHELDCALAPEQLGYALGANPLAILGPCHRIDCGGSVPPAFVGGTERRLWLRAHERQAEGDRVTPLRFSAGSD